MLRSISLREEMRLAADYSPTLAQRARHWWATTPANMRTVDAAEKVFP